MKEKNSFIFKKSYFDVMSELGSSTQSKVYQAIFDYVFKGKIINLTGEAKAIFILIKQMIDCDNKKHNTALENGKKGAEYGKLGGRPRKTINPIEKTFQNTSNIPNKQQEKIFLQKTNLTLGDIQKFKNSFPNRKIDLMECMPYVMNKNIYMQKLIDCIQESTFLINADNMSLSSCLKRYDLIIMGVYKNFDTLNPKNTRKKLPSERTYTKEDFVAQFDNIDLIDL